VFRQHFRDKTTYCKYWGGIGDIIFFLTYVHPFIRTVKNYHKIAVIDTTKEFAMRRSGKIVTDYPIALMQTDMTCHYGSSGCNMSVEIGQKSNDYS